MSKSSELEKEIQAYKTDGTVKPDWFERNAKRTLRGGVVAGSIALVGVGAGYIWKKITPDFWNTLGAGLVVIVLAWLVGFVMEKVESQETS